MEQPVVPWDLYREIHKATRYARFGVTTLAGQTDAADASAIRHLRDEWQRAAFVLAGHHKHEDRFCDPLVARYAPWLRDEIEAAHRRSEAAIAHLHRSAERLAHASAGESRSLLRTFYLDLADFTADYVRHLRDTFDGRPLAAVDGSGIATSSEVEPKRAATLHAYPRSPSISASTSASTWAPTSERGDERATTIATSLRAPSSRCARALAGRRRR